MFIPYMGMTAILVMWLHLKFGFEWPSSFRDILTDDRWTSDGGRSTDATAWVYYKFTLVSPTAPVNSKAWMSWNFCQIQDPDLDFRVICPWASEQSTFNSCGPLSTFNLIESFSFLQVTLTTLSVKRV